MSSKASYLGLALFVLIGVLPFAAAFTYALLYSLGLVGVVNEGFTLHYWGEVLASGEFARSLGYSATIAAVSVFISVGGALWLALTFRQDFERKFLAFFLYLPLAVPGVVAAFFTFQLFAKSGFFARLSFQLGWIEEVRQFPDLVNDPWAVGIVLTFITVVLPFFLLLFLNLYKNEQLGSLHDLAVSLGASHRQATFRVTLPVLLRRSWILISLYFLFLLGSYEVPLILGQESPQMLSVLVVRELKQYDLTKIPEGYVVAVIYTMVVSLGAILLFARRKSPLHEG